METQPIPEELGEQTEIQISDTTLGTNQHGVLCI
jgi:hypothetical protein